MFDVSVEAQVKYLRRRVGELELLLMNSSSVDLELAKKIGHQVKGNAATFGLESLAVFGTKLEESALSGNSQQVLIHAKEFLNGVRNLLTARSAL